MSLENSNCLFGLLHFGQARRMGIRNYEGIPRGPPSLPEAVSKTQEFSLGKAGPSFFVLETMLGVEEYGASFFAHCHQWLS